MKVALLFICLALTAHAFETETECPAKNQSRTKKVKTIQSNTVKSVSGTRQ